MAQFELVAVLLALMPHLIGRRAVHRAVVGVVLVGLQVAVVALAVEVVKRVFQRSAVVDPVVDDRTCPDGALLITAVGNVVVIEAVVLVDLQLTGLGVEHRRAPVRAVFMFVLILKRQGVGQIWGEVAEQGERDAPGIALVAVDVAVVGVAAYIQAGVMLHLGAGFGQRMVEAERHTGGVVAAVAQLAFDGLFLAGCQLGHVVQRATHGACAVDQGGGAAHQFDAVVDPRIHRPRQARGDIDAVEHLGDLAAGKPSVRDKPAKPGRCAGVDAGQGIGRITEGLGAMALDIVAVGDGHRRRGFPHAQAQARGHAAGLVQGQARLGTLLAINGGRRQLKG